MKHADISTKLIANYLATNYQVGTDEDMFILQINQYSKTLSQRLEENQKTFATIITAYNPFSQTQNNEQNLAANQKLLHALKQYSNPLIESINIDPSGIWPAEKSYCVFGLNLENSKFLGRKFNQNAIVWANSNAIPRLILLR